MSDNIFRWLGKTVTCRKLAILSVLWVLCVAAFQVRSWYLSDQSTPDAKLYAPSDLRKLLEGWSLNQRRLYAISEVTLDLVFPLIHGFLFSGLIVKLFSEEHYAWKLFFPSLYVVTDLVENITYASLATCDPGIRFWMIANAVYWITCLKFACFSISALLVCCGLLWKFWNCCRNRI